MTSLLQMEQRLENLEKSVAELKANLAGASAKENWLEKVIGSVSDEAAFEKVLEHGRAFRDADKSNDDSGEAS